MSTHTKKQVPPHIHFQDEVVEARNVQPLKPAYRGMHASGVIIDPNLTLDMTNVSWTRTWEVEDFNSLAAYSEVKVDDDASGDYMVQRDPTAPSANNVINHTGLSLPVGDYHFIFRLKVDDNSSGYSIIRIGVYSATHGGFMGSRYLAPSDFNESGIYKAFAIRVNIPADYTDIAIVMTEWVTGLTYLKADWVGMLPANIPLAGTGVSADPATQYSSANSATQNTSADPATQNTTANSATQNTSANSATQNTSADSATQNTSADPATQYSSANAATQYTSSQNSRMNWTSILSGNNSVSITSSESSIYYGVAGYATDAFNAGVILVQLTFSSGGPAYVKCRVSMGGSNLMTFVDYLDSAQPYVRIDRFFLLNLNGQAFSVYARVVSGNTVGATVGLTIVAMQTHYHPMVNPSHNTGLNNPSHSTGVTNPAHSTGVTNPSHATGINNPSHTTGITNPSHNTTINNPSHATGINNPAHSTTINDPEHDHSD